MSGSPDYPDDHPSIIEVDTRKDASAEIRFPEFSIIAEDPELEAQQGHTHSEIQFQLTPLQTALKNYEEAHATLGKIRQLHGPVEKPILDQSLAQLRLA